MSGHDYRDRLRDHYGRYADHWFGGHHSWRHFIHGCEPAPWFWPQYYSLCAYPWVFGFYEPVLYVRYGLPAPVWYGYVYTPWWDWCDAPFVYYYYRYPARFSFNLSVGDTYSDVSYADISYTDGVDDADVAYDRPLGVWVPGHYDQTVDGEWVWTPGYYMY